MKVFVERRIKQYYIIPPRGVKASARGRAENKPKRMRRLLSTDGLYVRIILQYGMGNNNKVVSRIRA